MKKIWKRISMLLILVPLVFSLTACDALDEMRQSHLLLEKDGSFYFEGVRYVPLDANDYFNPLIEDFGTIYYLTQPDVPVLLSSGFAEASLRFTEDRRFAYSPYGSVSWYCQEDIYEEIQERNNAPFVPEVLYYQFSGYDTERQVYVTKSYTLTPAEQDAVMSVLAGEPLALQDGIYLSYDFYFSMFEASADELFQHDGPNLCGAGDTFYLEVYTDEGEVTYLVPEELNPVFQQIVAAYHEFYGR